VSANRVAGLEVPTATHRAVSVHLRLTLKALGLGEFIAPHIQIAGFSVCRRKEAGEPGESRQEMKTNELFFLDSFGAEGIAADHCTDGGLYLPTKLGRFGVRIWDARPGILCLVGVRVLRGSDSRGWTGVDPWLIVFHEFGVGTRIDELWVMATNSGINGGVVLLL
jgi:hypothetical protein